jgi:histidine triad (HIT) family protein
MASACIFCRIIAERAPAEILFRDERVTAFQDIHPLSPVHILVVPNEHIVALNDIDLEHEALLGHMIYVAQKLAEAHGIQHSGYRLVINTGPNAGQSVLHLHLHLLGGRHLPFRFE